MCLKSAQQALVPAFDGLASLGKDKQVMSEEGEKPKTDATFFTRIITRSVCTARKCHCLNGKTHFNKILAGEGTRDRVVKERERV